MKKKLTGFLAVLLAVVMLSACSPVTAVEAPTAEPAPTAEVTAEPVATAEPAVADEPAAEEPAGDAAKTASKQAASKSQKEQPSKSVSIERKEVEENEFATDPVIDAFFGGVGEPVKYAEALDPILCAAAMATHYEPNGWDGSVANAKIVWSILYDLFIDYEIAGSISDKLVVSRDDVMNVMMEVFANYYDAIPAIPRDYAPIVKYSSSKKEYTILPASGEGVWAEFDCFYTDEDDGVYALMDIYTLGDEEGEWLETVAIEIVEDSYADLGYTIYTAFLIQ